jgi:hypothetical protein
MRSSISARRRMNSASSVVVNPETSATPRRTGPHPTPRVAVSSARNAAWYKNPAVRACE